MGNSNRILLVMQRRSLADRITALLEEYVFEVHRCSDPVRAINESCRLDPGLVLCEADMPVLSGFQLARLFKRNKRLAAIPFVLVSHNLPDFWDMYVTGTSVEADDVFQLPLAEDQFRKRITDWITPGRKPDSLIERTAGPLRSSPGRSEPRTWKKGSINCVAPCRMVYHVIRQQDSGRLFVRHGAFKMDARVDRAWVADVISNHIPGETFGAYLERNRKISRSEAENAFHASRVRSARVGEILLDQGVLEPHEIEYHLTRHKIEKLCRLTDRQWRGGAFEFRATHQTSGDRPNGLFSLAGFLKDLVFGAIDVERMKNAFTRSGRLDDRIHLNDHFESVAGEFHLNTDSVEGFTALEGKTLNGMRMIDPNTYDDQVRALFFLVITHSVYFESATSRVAPADRTKADSPCPAVTDETDRGAATPFRWDIDKYNRHVSHARELIESNDFATARNVLTEALAAQPYGSEAMAMLGWSNYHLARDDVAKGEAKEMIKRALSLNDSDDGAMVYLGRILKHEGKIGLAGSFFRRALEVNPANEEASHEVDLARIRRRTRKLFTAPV